METTPATITDAPHADYQSSLAMQAGLALLDLAAALRPKSQAARRNMRRQLRKAVRESDKANWFQRSLLEKMIQEIR